MDYQGKAALVTGGGTGVGRATALALAERGCGVVVNYSRSKDDAEKTAAECEARGVRALAVEADVSQDDACLRLVDAAVRTLGRLDFLVQSAGTTAFIPHAKLDDVTPEIWQRIMGVNVVGPFQMARAAKRALEASGDGQIVMISSTAGIAAKGSSIPYCASKAALNNLVVTLARVFAPKVRVNAIAPGAITGRWLKEGYGEEAYENLMKGVRASVPLQKPSEPEDVADAILSLLGGSRLITGQVLVCDGGMVIG